MQEISLMQKSIHWFMNEMVVKRRDTSITDYFSPLVNHQVPSRIRKLVSIVHKPYLFYDCERPYVKSVEYSTWVTKVQSVIKIPANLHWSTGILSINGSV